MGNDAIHPTQTAGPQFPLIIKRAGVQTARRAAFGDSLTRRWAYVALWSVVILVGTSIPGEALQGAPIIPGADKVVHAVMYGVFGWLVAAALSTARPQRYFVAAWLGITVFAAADEWHQLWIPGRSADSADWLADVVAAAAAIWLFNKASKRRERIA